MVWFGEMLPDGAMESATEAAKNCELFLNIGTSAMVYPAAELPDIARRNGAVVVEVNPDPSPIALFANFTLTAPSGVALPALVRAAWEDAR